MDNPKTELELRRWLARKLKREGVPPWLWRWLKGRGYVREALDDPDEDALNDLADEARSLIRTLRLAEGQRVLPGRRNPVQVKADLSAEEAARSYAFSRYLRFLASRDEGVRSFRKQILAGRTLPPKKAAMFLSSPAPYLLSADEFESQSIPILSHRAQATLTRHDIDRVSWLQRISMRVEWEGGAREYQLEIRRTAADRNWLAVPPQAWPVEKYPLAPSSLFERLRAVSIALTARYPWHEWEAVWFVLTGACPQVFGIQFGVEERRFSEYGRCLLNLSVEPWVSARTVERVYRQAQREMLGQDNRPIGVKNLAVFAFVVDRAAEGTSAESWAQLVAEWNRSAKPGWMYGDFRHFRRDFRRVGQAIVVPRHHRIRSAPARKGAPRKIR